MTVQDDLAGKGRVLLGRARWPAQAPPSLLEIGCCDHGDQLQGESKSRIARGNRVGKVAVLHGQLPPRYKSPPLLAQPQWLREILPVNATVQLVGTSLRCSAHRRKDSSTYLLNSYWLTTLDSTRRFRKTLVGGVLAPGQYRKGNDTYCCSVSANFTRKSTFRSLWGTR